MHPILVEASKNKTGVSPSKVTPIGVIQGVKNGQVFNSKCMMAHIGMHTTMMSGMCRSEV